MKYLFYLGIILVMLSLNMQLAGVFLKTGIQFNLLLPVIVLSALEKRNYDFVFIAIVSGLFLDVFGGAPFGSFLILCGPRGAGRASS